MKYSLLLVTLCVACSSTATIPARTPSSDEQAVVEKPLPFPSSIKSIPDRDSKILVNATAGYCSSFRGALSGPILAKKDQEMLSFKNAKAFYDRVCKFENGKDVWVSLADSQDDAFTKFLIDRLSFDLALDLNQKFVKELWTQRGGSDSTYLWADQRFYKELLQRIKGASKLFSATGWDAEGKINKAEGLLVDLLGDKLTPAELAGKQSEYTKWVQYQTDLIIGP